MNRLITVFLIIVSAALPAYADEYPTEETVRYVLGCMAELGGQNDRNLYTCACRYDAIRSQMVFTEYEEGVTYERNKAMPGKKGGFFRDNERGERFYQALLKAREQADKSCIVVKHVELVRPAKQN